MIFLITGDFVITDSYRNDELLDKSVKQLFNESDFRIVNLEAPVTKSTSKILKTGPHLKAHKDSTKEVLKELKVDLTTLANNHVLDYDEQGVLDTLDFCNENKIATVGAGKDKKDASKIFCLENKIGKIAIINIAENEWASATSATAGANGMDLIDDVVQIQKAKKENNFVFVIVHGGHEYYNLPSPRMQKQYRFYIDNGADLVVGHHTHCFSGMETYKNKPIYYSLGNFLFTKPSKFEDWYKGIVLKVDITENKEIKTQPIFVKQCKEDFKVSLIEGEELNTIANSFKEYSNLIKNESLLINHWKNFTLKKSKLYYNYWSPLSFIKNKWIKAILMKIGFNGSNKRTRALFLNLIRCEAHLDLSEEALKKYLK